MLKRINLYTALFTVSVILLLSNCSNIFTPQSATVNGLRITLSGAVIDARTLYPEDPTFTKFVLSFNHQENPEAIRESISLGANITTVLVDELVLGLWTVTATGFVTINEVDYAVARGSEVIEIKSQEEGNLNITLSAMQDPNGDPGTLSYSITYPADKVNNGYIYIYSLDGNSNTNHNLGSSPAYGDISITPGFYRMVIQLNDGYKDVRRSEIIHIYSNLVTNAEFVFTNDDFIDLITLSGTVNVRVGTQNPDSASISVYIDDGSNYLIGSSSIDLTNNSWSMVHPAFDNDVPLYFYITASYEGHSYSINSTAETLGNASKSISLGTVTIPAITLSGTVNATYGANSSQVSEISLNIYDDTFGLNRSVTLSTPRENNNWAVTMPAFSATTNIIYSVTCNQFFDDGNGGYTEEIFNQTLAQTSSVHNTNVSGIALNVGPIQSLVKTVGAQALTQNTWFQRTNDTGADDWYSISVTNGTTYYLWWNELYYGNYTKTMDVQVHAFYDNETPIYLSNRDYAWDTPVSFTATKSGTVYLRVRASYSPGTYDIAYNVTNTRPILDSSFLSGKNPTSLSSGWTNGTIAVAYEEDWYTISATAGGTYYIWCNNLWYGNGLKTIPVDVTIWSANGSPITLSSSLWDNPASYAASSNGLIYIRVRYNNAESGTGTYGIAYSTNNSRPVIDPSNNTAIALTENVWKDGNITTAGENAWYYINTVTGTTYYLWWNDSYSGNNSKTLDIDVTAWYNDGSLFFDPLDSAWDNPVSFTASSNGKIYIRVRALDGSPSTGTYELVYNTSGTRP